jgi:hypothetical protein
MGKYAMLIIGAVAAGLTACSSGEHMTAAEQALSEFRQRMSGREYAKIYANGSDELRKSASEADFLKILGAMDAKLGPVKTTERATWNLNFHTQGTFVSMAFKTDFANGAGTEQFVFRVAEGRAALVSYHVNSTALLLN